MRVRGCEAPVLRFRRNRARAKRGVPKAQPSPKAKNLRRRCERSSPEAKLPLRTLFGRKRSFRWKSFAFPRAACCELDEVLRCGASAASGTLRASLAGMLRIPRTLFERKLRFLEESGALFAKRTSFAEAFTDDERAKRVRNSSSEARDEPEGRIAAGCEAAED